MKLLLLAAAGGALGTAARYLVNLGVAHWFNPSWPWATPVVNVLGCGLMGALYMLFARWWPGGEGLRIFLATGVLGGFTTFSAFTLDVWLLVERGAHAAAALYLAGSIVCAMLAFVGGLALAKVLLT